MLYLYSSIVNTQHVIID